MKKQRTQSENFLQIMQGISIYLKRPFEHGKQKLKTQPAYL